MVLQFSNNFTSNNDSSLQFLRICDKLPTVQFAIEFDDIFEIYLKEYLHTF